MQQETDYPVPHQFIINPWHSAASSKSTPKQLEIAPLALPNAEPAKVRAATNTCVMEDDKGEKLYSFLSEHLKENCDRS